MGTLAILQFDQQVTDSCYSSVSRLTITLVELTLQYRPANIRLMLLSFEYSLLSKRIFSPLTERTNAAYL